MPIFMIKAQIFWAHIMPIYMKIFHRWEMC